MRVKFATAIVVKAPLKIAFADTVSQIGLCRKVQKSCHIYRIPSLEREEIALEYCTLAIKKQETWAAKRSYAESSRLSTSSTDENKPGKLQLVGKGLINDN